MELRLLAHTRKKVKCLPLAGGTLRRGLAKRALTSMQVDSFCLRPCDSTDQQSLESLPGFMDGQGKLYR